MLDFSKLVNNPEAKRKAAEARAQREAEAYIYDKKIRMAFDLLRPEEKTALLDDRERKFVGSCQRQYFSSYHLTEKQEKWLLDLARRADQEFDQKQVDIKAVLDALDELRRADRAALLSVPEGLFVLECQRKFSLGRRLTERQEAWLLELADGKPTAVDIQQHFNREYGYQDGLKDVPVVQQWISSVNDAVDAMDGVEIVFYSRLTSEIPQNEVYLNHSGQVAVLLPPQVKSVDGESCADEVCLPYHRIRFADGTEICAEATELKCADDPRLGTYMAAAGGAFAIASERGYAGPWELVSSCLKSGDLATIGSFADEFDSLMSRAKEKEAEHSVGRRPTM